MTNPTFAVATARVRATVRVGKRILARALVKQAGHKQLIVAHLTKPGRKLLHQGAKLIVLW